MNVVKWNHRYGRCQYSKFKQPVIHIAVIATTSSHQRINAVISFLGTCFSPSLIITKLPLGEKGQQSQSGDIRMTAHEFFWQLQEVPSVWLDYRNYHTFLSLELSAKLNRIQSEKKEFPNQILFIQLPDDHLVLRVYLSLPQPKTMGVSPFLKTFPFPSIIKSQLMPRIKNAYKIKRGRPRVQKDINLTECAQEDVDQQIPEERPVPQHFKEETPIKRAVKMDPRNISNLSEEERAKIKSEHPQMNEYFLMSARDKSKYFHLLNQKYRQDMKLAQPPGSAPMKKTIKFKKRFEIKPFGYHQKCEQIHSKRSFMELYKAKHDSKRKTISKFPKNV